MGYAPSIEEILTAQRAKKKARRPREARRPECPPDWEGVTEAFLAKLVADQDSPLTITTYRGDLRRFAQWYRITYHDEPIITSIDEIDLRAYSAYLEGEKFSVTSHNRRLSPISGLLDWALKNQWITIPVDKPKLLEQVEKPIRWLEVLEERAVLREVKAGGNLRDRTMIYMFLRCGHRVSGLATQTWDRIKMSQRDGEIKITEKGNKTRVVPLDNDTRVLLAALLRHEWDFPGVEDLGNQKLPWKFTGKVRMRPRDPKRLEYLKPDADGTVAASDIRICWGTRGPLTQSGIARYVTYYGNNAKLELSCHDLRHTCIRRWCEQQKSIVDLEAVARLAGHSNINTTRRYLQASESDLAELVERRAKSAI